MTKHLLGLALAALAWAGCETSVSYKAGNFSGENPYAKTGPSAPQLHEHEVLGLKPTGAISEADIERALEQAGTLRLQRGSKLLVVQSGAAHPDRAMIDELSRHFTVIPHTGLPADLRQGAEGASVSKALRLAAAHSKAETILVYWGHLEMKRNDLPTSLVSWVPVVDFAVPDEYQKARMHVKVALIDVRTGHWATYRTEPIEQDALTTRYARERQPGHSLERTRQRVYESAVKRLADGYLASAR